MEGKERWDRDGEDMRYWSVLPRCPFLVEGQSKKTYPETPCGQQGAFNTLNNTSSSQNNSVYLLKRSEKTGGELLTEVLLNSSDRLILS